MISSKILEKVFNLQNTKQPKRKTLYCSVCKCKTLKVEEKIGSFVLWNCTRPKHEYNEQKYWESIAIKNLDNQYAEELTKIEKEV